MGVIIEAARQDCTTVGGKWPHVPWAIALRGWEVGCICSFVRSFIDCERSSVLWIRGVGDIGIRLVSMRITQVGLE